jgi:hypothetical protein
LVAMITSEALMIAVTDARFDEPEFVNGLYGD